MGFQPDSQLIIRQPEHNHAANPARVEVREALNEMKAQAKAQPDKSTRRIMLEGQSTASQEAAAAFPTADAIRQRLIDQREDAYKEFVIAETLAEMNIPEQLQTRIYSSLTSAFTRWCRFTF